MTEEKKEEAPKGKDDMWAKIRSSAEDITKIKNALERLLGIDIDKDGKIGGCKIWAMALVALLSIGLMGYGYTVERYLDASDSEIYKLDDSGNLIISGVYSGASFQAGTVTEAALTTPSTDGLNVKRTARMAFTSANLLVGSNSLSSITIPDNAIIDFGYIDVTTICSSTNAGSTFTLSLQAEQDLRLTETGDVSAAITAIIPVGTAATAVKATAARSPWISVTVGSYTGGAGVVVFEYTVSD